MTSLRLRYHPCVVSIACLHFFHSYRSHQYHWVDFYFGCLSRWVFPKRKAKCERDDCYCKVAVDIMLNVTGKWRGRYFLFVLFFNSLETSQAMATCESKGEAFMAAILSYYVASRYSVECSSIILERSLCFSYEYWIIWYFKLILLKFKTNHIF